MKRMWLGVAAVAVALAVGCDDAGGASGEGDSAGVEDTSGGGGVDAEGDSSASGDSAGTDTSGGDGGSPDDGEEGADGAQGGDANAQDVDGAGEGTDTEEDSGSPDEDVAIPEECELHEVACEDESFLQLALKDAVAPGGVTNEPQADGWLSVVDATAGGFSPTESFVYFRFTDGGLEKVAISDEDAVADSSWHIAFRRYIIRLNSGVSGPGCVKGAPLIALDFESLTQVPPGVSPFEEAYFNASCQFVPDDSGLDGPKTVMSTFWTYTGCVTMTNQIYALRLDDGRWVKAQVQAFYYPEVQQVCQDTGSAPMGNTGSGTIRLRWAYLPE